MKSEGFLYQFNDCQVLKREHYPENMQFSHKAVLCSRTFHLQDEFVILIYICMGVKREGDKGTKGTKRIR